MTVEEFEKRAGYQNGYDREFGKWKVIDIHQIPVSFNLHHELDFYCSNGEAVYLLRVRPREIEHYTINAGRKAAGTMTYLIAEFPVHELNDMVLKSTLKRFELDNGHGL